MTEPRLVLCAKLGKKLPGLTFKPFSNELGQRIYDSVSQEAWKMWLAQQTMIINEGRLSLGDPKTRAMLHEQMEQFLFGGEAQPPPGSAPAPK